MPDSRPTRWSGCHDLGEVETSRRPRTTPRQAPDLRGGGESAIALFTSKNEVEALREQLAQANHTIHELQGWVWQLRGAETAQLEADLRGLRGSVEHAKAKQNELEKGLAQIRDETKVAAAELVETRERALLQEVGIYEYAHPLDDAVGYKEELAKITAAIKSVSKVGEAVQCSTEWTVGGSATEGKKMVREVAKLMLRAYNTEADNAVRSVKPHTREAVKKRLSTARDRIAKLGKTMNIFIAWEYHQIRLTEIDLTADYLMKREVEREAERERKAQLREEAKAQKEFERERARLDKERAHYQSVVDRLTASGDEAALAKAQEQLAAVDDAISGVDARAANIRAGYVYVISNIGSFGPDIVKIGMTRRLEPMDRVRELGDASVPFRFDVHALFFSDDAVALETALHQRFAEQKVNLVNQRREFFYATPADVHDALMDLGNGQVLEYTDDPEAVEWRASDPSRRGKVAEAAL